jgi:hypothetical protein
MNLGEKARLENSKGKIKRKKEKRKREVSIELGEKY